MKKKTRSGEIGTAGYELDPRLRGDVQKIWSLRFLFFGGYPLFLHHLSPILCYTRATVKRVWKKLLPPVFAVLLVAPTAFFAYPNKSDAIIGCLGGYLFNSLIGGIQAVGDAVRKIAVSESTVAQNTNKTSSNTQGALLKECILDITAKQIARAVLQSFTKSVVSWINSGFEGKPSFVTNPTGFLMDVADREFGREIRKIAPILCSPFRLNLQFALGLQYSLNTKEEVGCRLSDVIANARGSYDSFVSGDFRSGGWRNWVTITNTPQNNIYGAYLGAVGRLDASIISATGEEVKLLDFGKGFKSWRSCDERAPDEKDKNGKVLRRGECTKPGKIKTPGSIIVDQTSGTLQSSLRELEVADEIDEIFGALVNQLLIRTLGPGGLLGNSEPEPGGGPSYLDQLVNSPENAERLASIRPPEGIDCSREYEASGNLTDPNQVMVVSYRRTDGEITRVEEVPATATMPRIQRLTIKLLEGPATGTTVVVEHIVRVDADALVVSPARISFDRFPDSYVGVQTIRFPQEARKPDGTLLKRDPGIHPQWSDYFTQVRQGCRNKINLYAERENDRVITRAGAPSVTPPVADVPPPPAQIFEGNIASGKFTRHIGDDCPDVFGIAIAEPYAYVAIDGNKSGGMINYPTFSCTTGSAWEVDLETSADSKKQEWKGNEIREITIYRPAGDWLTFKGGAYGTSLHKNPFNVKILDTDRNVAYEELHSHNDFISGPVTVRIPEDKRKGRYVQVVKTSGTLPLGIAEVVVTGKQTRIDTGTGATTPPASPLAVLFNRSSDTPVTISIGALVSVDPTRPIRLTANKDATGVSLRIKLLAETAPTATPASTFMPKPWAQYFNSFMFSFAAANKADTTPPFVVPGDFSDTVINPDICDGTRGVKATCHDLLGVGVKSQDMSDNGSWITVAEGLSITPSQPINIGFNGTLKTSGLGDRKTRILIEADYTGRETTTPKPQFYADFIIN